MTQDLNTSNVLDGHNMEKTQIENNAQSQLKDQDEKSVLFLK